jgi:hypothetical protein
MRSLAFQLRLGARADLGADWIGQKKEKSGKGEATDQHRPIAHIKTKQPTPRHSNLVSARLRGRHRKNRQPTSTSVLHVANNLFCCGLRGLIDHQPVRRDYGRDCEKYASYDDRVFNCSRPRLHRENSFNHAHRCLPPSRTGVRLSSL